MASQEQQQQQQANRGILPSETLNALDYLVDRLNAASGRLPSTAAVTPTGVVPASPTPNNATADASNITTKNNDQSPLPIRALLVGTNEGVGLSRSLGTAHTASQMSNPNDPNFSHSGSMSEEVLSSIETVWATLVSAAPPHVMAASAAAAASASSPVNNNNGNDGGGKGGEEEKKEDTIPPHIQPPHPLLSPLQMGDHIRTVTATYENCTLVHVHMAPLVVTFVTLPEANIGAIRSTALPLLKILLEPVRRALVRSRGGGAVAAAAGGEGNVAAGGGGSAVVGQPQMGMQGQSMEQQAAAAQQQQQVAQQQQQQQALAFMQQQQQQQQSQQQDMMGGQQQQQGMQGMYAGQQGTMDPVLQQQLYQQQLYQQQQMMMAQQQQFQQ